MANSVDPNEFYLDLHCLHRYWFWSAVMKGLKGTVWYDFLCFEDQIGSCLASLNMSRMDRFRSFPHMRNVSSGHLLSVDAF